MFKCVHIYCYIIPQDLPTLEMMDPQNRKISFFIEVSSVTITITLGTSLLIDSGSSLCTILYEAMDLVLQLSASD